MSNVEQRTFRMGCKSLQTWDGCVMREPDVTVAFLLSSSLSSQVEERFRTLVSDQCSSLLYPQTLLSLNDMHAADPNTVLLRCFSVPRGFGCKPRRFTVTTQPIMCCIRAWLGYEGKISFTFCQQLPTSCGSKVSCKMQ